MPFGVLSVGDLARDPLSGRTPGGAERTRAAVTIARKIEEAGA